MRIQLVDPHIPAVDDTIGVKIDGKRTRVLVVGVRRDNDVVYVRLLRNGRTLPVEGVLVLPTA